MISNKKIILNKNGCVMALIILASLILISIKTYSFDWERFWHTKIVFQKIDDNKTAATEETKNNNANAEASLAETLVNKKEKLPVSVFIDVPFTSQAPFGKWDIYHEEACEEASLLMVAYYMQNKKLTPVVAEKELQSLISYEIKNAKSYEDSTVAEIAKLGMEYYGLKNVHVIYDFSIQDLKKYLAKGLPIIVPVAGRLLKNPNFTAPGPLYHNLVLIGYDGDTVITNDPGTRKGQNYRYNLKMLYDAIHDFPGDKLKIETGRKAMLVFANF